MTRFQMLRRTHYMNEDEQALYAGLEPDAPGLPERLPPRPVSVLEQWYEQLLGDGWVAAFRLGEQGQRLVVAELRLFPSAGPREPLAGRWAADVLGTRAPVPRGGLKARTLGLVKLRAFERDLGALLRAYHLPRLRGPEPSPTGETRGRKPNLRRYAEVAQAYEKAYAAGSSRPTAAVAARLKMTAGAARAAVARARTLGMLTATVRGERGGRAMQRAIDLMTTQKGRTQR